MKFLPAFILLLFLSGCEKKGSPKTITLDKVETISFRRSYVDHQNLTDEQVDILHKANPSPESGMELQLSDELKKAQILDGLGNLIVGNFKRDLKTKSIGKKTEVNYLFDFVQANAITVLIEKDTAKAQKHIDFEGYNFEGIAYTDLDNDAIEELLILENYYIMNGDNFVLTIYKLNL